MEHTEAHSAIVSPGGTWWLPAGKQEKRWVILAFVWCLILFAMMPTRKFTTATTALTLTSVSACQSTFRPVTSQVRNRLPSA